ncbi:H-2 class II histocompatibility antigen, A-Q alpha chain-like [Colossoma macropomum]|uniref:H-2 class II histocompatibility antigen, A-Q alpha chain-like n=1 Tax=Colossoma macropomum TaxID=42526 RepID=UPI001864B305|nr:H-2 class II histocompatibility antigen, A-Q alpha chain-like [Colossoma macropomum]
MYEFVSSTLIKMKLCLILVCAALLYTEAKIVHKDITVSLCSDTFREYMYGLDGEEKYHADFTKGEGVMTLPDFADPFLYPVGFYQLSLGDMEVCRNNLDFCAKRFNYPAEPKDAPQSSLYSKNDVELGSNNTLVCYITGFYPPHVGVSWTKNNVNITDGASLSRYYINSDGTYKAVSTLSFIPEEGDIYTCTVDHTALDRRLTKTWDVQVTQPSVGPTVFCGVGLAAGLLGVAVGTFFLVKGINCN